MKLLNECKEYRELIMQEIDGIISHDGKEMLDMHLKACPDCGIYLKNMVKISKTLAVSYEVPVNMEAKIMAKITEKPAFAINLRPVLSYAASFGLVMLVSLFIIYRSFDNKTVTVADQPVVQNKAVAVKPDLKPEPKAVAPEVNTAANKSQNNILTAVTTIKNDTNNSNTTEHGPSVKIASNSQEASVTAPKDDVVKTGETSGLVMLKPGVLPTTTDNPLLDRDGAIVANNLINPLRGEFATIIVKVTEPANVKIIVYDKNVRPISKILDAYKDRGTYEATWEGRTDNNETVSDGIYFVYIQIGTRVIKKSIIVNK